MTAKATPTPDTPQVSGGGADPAPVPAEPIPEQVAAPGDVLPDLPESAYPADATPLELTGGGTDPLYRADPPAEPDAGEVANANVAAALEAMAEANPSPVTPDPAEPPEKDPPVYDERGNVRPRGTPGAKPMTKAERIKIAARLNDGERIVTTAEKPRKG